MKKQTGIIIAVIIIVIIIIALVKSKQSSSVVTPTVDNTAGQQMETGEGVTPSVDTTSQPNTPPATTTPTTKSFTVTGSNYSFTPNTLTVNKGDLVKITFKNSGGMHDFKIDEFNVATERLESGDSTTIQFVANKTGTFQYYCSVGSHRAMGMWGTLTVQ